MKYIIITLPESVHILCSIPVYCQHFLDSIFLPEKCLAWRSCVTEENIKLPADGGTEAGGLNVAGLSGPQTALDLHWLDEVIFTLCPGQIHHKPPLSVDIPSWPRKDHECPELSKYQIKFPYKPVDLTHICRNVIFRVWMTWMTWMTTLSIYKRLDSRQSWGRRSSPPRHREESRWSSLPPVYQRPAWTWSHG